MEATYNSIGQVMHPRSPQSLLRGARISILHGITARTAKLWLFMSCRARCEAMAHSSNQLAGWEKTSPPSMQCLSHTIDKPNTSYTTDLIIQGFSMLFHAGRLQRHLRTKKCKSCKCNVSWAWSSDVASKWKIRVGPRTSSPPQPLKGHLHPLLLSLASKPPRPEIRSAGSDQPPPPPPGSSVPTL